MMSEYVQIAYSIKTIISTNLEYINTDVLPLF